MPVISFGEINKYLAIPLIGGISKCIVETILYNNPAKINKHPFLIGINAGLSMCLAIIPFIYIKKRTNKTDEDFKIINRKLIYSYEYYKNYNEKEMRLQKIFLILLTSFMEFLQKFLSYSFIHSVDNNIWICNILFFSFFSYIILNTKLYLHQYLSCLVIIIFGLGLNIMTLYDMTVPQIPQLFLSILIELIYSLNPVVNKHTMEYKFCTPYEICFFEGLFIFIVNTLLLIISTNVNISSKSKLTKVFKNEPYHGKIYFDNFFQFYEQINSHEVLIFFVSLLNRFIFNLFSLITIKYYTPSHVILLLIIGESQFAFELEDDVDPIKLIFTIIIFVIIFFMLLIFTEIIEINLWGLEKNTKRYIKERAGLKEDMSVKDEDSNNFVRDTEYEMPSIEPKEDN